MTRSHQLSILVPFLVVVALGSFAIVRLLASEPTPVSCNLAAQDARPGFVLLANLSDDCAR